MKLDSVVLTSAGAREVFQEVMALIREALLKGNPVTLPNVCTLTPYTKKARNFRHPQTGKLFRVERTKYVRLILSSGLKNDLGA